MVCHVGGVKVARLRHVLRSYFRTVLQVSGNLLHRFPVRVTVVVRRVNDCLGAGVQIRDESGCEFYHGAVRCPFAGAFLMLRGIVVRPRTRKSERGAGWLH